MIRLDDQDLKILLTLQREGRITKVKLAEAVNLSPSPCWERLKRLEDLGVISGYHAHINLEMLVKPTLVMTEVTLRHHQHEDFAIFEKAVQDIPEIVECYALGGGVDYMLKVLCRDVDAYQRLIDGLLIAGIGIDRYFTYIVTKKVKVTPVPPIDALLDPGGRK
ncbi:Lrp/AsnC family transcriptional regulator of ectoine degradation [Thalassospira sp. MBR-102]|jgi:Lrp/AsnC family transcriptional regulator of ectoine degradation|uniref:Transcriptional regulator n=1 Tax=Thalassospira xiamenensis M-5 = DSM 17429 TaxID=1123366 RepID=A0AB72U907_9PROT|nr:Lrp/AsnC family transcriptional regulator [Thalassospira xiamenensis]AJD50642.1 transcriptional regulator [Thalassospira xiamenensis M-5 = DSM 17429]SIS75008.1 transcriptional regulator, AsnC family [Thalassospira xiamenensis M-5 = DSM 17429]